jgi:glycine cleavage system H protein
LKFPSELHYTKSHEWIHPDGSTHRFGITDFAQSELSDIVFVELPEVGRSVNKGEVCAVIESCKAASDVYVPVSGKVVEINQRLVSEPELVNQDPYGEGWLFAIETSDEGELQQLMDAEAYRNSLSPM